VLLGMLVFDRLAFSVLAENRNTHSGYIRPESIVRDEFLVYKPVTTHLRESDLNRYCGVRED
jgi:hypothetical protein